MKKTLHFSIYTIVLLIGLSLAAEGFAQTSDDINRSIYETSPDIARQQQRQAEQQRKLDQERADGFPIRPYKKQKSFKDKIEEMKAEEAITGALIVPHADDLAKYKNFLSLSRAGLFRLLPNFNCEQKNVIYADGKCAHLTPGFSAYSFQQREYSTNLGFFDIQLNEGNLISKGFLSQGILTELGDVPLEDISLASQGLKFLNEFKPELKNTEVRKQYKQIADGINSDGYIYTKSIKATNNTTYALRVIAYRTENKLVDRGTDKYNINDSRFMKLEFGNADKRLDFIIVFRVIRTESDGNITILWKELARKKAPKIVFTKNELASDINP